MNSFSLWNKQKSLGVRTIHLLTRQFKHWLPSKMPDLNYSVTEHPPYSPFLFVLQCTNGWLEDQEQQFFCNWIRALEKRWSKCISVAGDYAVPFQNWGPIPHFLPSLKLDESVFRARPRNQPLITRWGLLSCLRDMRSGKKIKNSGKI